MYGHSPPPGHHPEPNPEPNFDKYSLPDLKNNGGIFIPEDNHETEQTPTAEGAASGFPGRPPSDSGFNEDRMLPEHVLPQRALPDSRTTANFYMQQSYDSLLGSSSPLSVSHISVASEDPSYARFRPHRHGERRRPLSDLIPDTVTLFEYDSGRSSLHHYATLWSLTESSV